MANGLKLETSDGEQYLVEPRSLVVFADETGSATLSDPGYPVFGLGGISILANDHDASISEPWRELKTTIFGEERHPFHTSDLPRLRDDDIVLLGHFLRHAAFSRSAIAVTTRTAQDVDTWVLAARYLMKSAVALTEPGSYSSVTVIAEQGQEKHWRRAAAGWPSPVPATVQFLEKNPSNHGLEIADLTATTWGRHARHAHGHGIGAIPAVYDGIFKPEGPGQAKAIVVDSAILNNG